jgi:FkbM family methyltransferase
MPMIRVTSPTKNSDLGGNELVATNDQWTETSCEFRGTDNSLVLQEGARCNRANIIFFGSASSISVGRSSRLSGKISLGHNCIIKLGSNNTITANLELSAAEGTEIHIGSDCMFGIGCRVITHDFHPIFDALTNERLNVSRSVIIEDHVWVGDGAVIRKGVRIGSGSVIGERALVLHDVPSNSVVVGSPAKVVRKNIRWERDSLRSLAVPKKFAEAPSGSSVLRGLIQSFEFNERIFRFFINNENDEISKYLIGGTFYEEEELRLISSYVSAEDSIIDVGANIGNHSIYFASVLGCKNILTFEMNQTAQAIADINYLLNSLSNIVTKSGYALGKSNGSGRISAEEHNLGGATLILDDNGPVKVLRGDDVIGDFKPTFIKIDVEGGEHDVLAGFEETIRRFRPKLFIEVHESNEQRLATWIAANGYSIAGQHRRYRLNRNLMLVPV